MSFIYIGPRDTVIQHVTLHRKYPKGKSYGVSVNRNGILRHAGHRFFHIALLKAWLETWRKA